LTAVVQAKAAQQTSNTGRQNQIRGGFSAGKNN